MKDDFSKLKEMKYSGRGITVGLTPEGNPFIGYTLTGRSPSSQARKLVYDGENTIRTDVTDRKQLETGNTALLLYPAIVNVDGRLIASNGVQTELIYSVANKSRLYTPYDLLYKTFVSSFYRYDEKNKWLDITSFEPDFPNNTPRISACLDKNQGAMHIVQSVNGTKKPNLYSMTLEPGKARIITTYKGMNENPLLPFEGEPLEARILSNNSNDIAGSLYFAIESKDVNNYCVSTAVMMIKKGKLDVSKINRFDIKE
jgi:IMP cyclohydrolase